MFTKNYDYFIIIFYEKLIVGHYFDLATHQVPKRVAWTPTKWPKIDKWPKSWMVSGSLDGHVGPICPKYIYTDTGN